jgi:hypothetical protein
MLTCSEVVEMRATLQNPEWLTTGHVAKAIGADPRTVSKWVDSGLLAGHKLPGSKDRRILRSAFLSFCEANKLIVAELPRAWQPGDEVAGAVVVDVEGIDMLMRCPCQCTFRIGLETLRIRERALKPRPLRCFGCSGRGKGRPKSKGAS